MNQTFDSVRHPCSSLDRLWCSEFCQITLCSSAVPFQSRHCSVSFYTDLCHLLVHFLWDIFLCLSFLIVIYVIVCQGILSLASFLCDSDLLYVIICRGILSLAWCPSDSDLLLSCGKDNRILCWNPNTESRAGEVCLTLFAFVFIVIKRPLADSLVT